VSNYIKQDRRRLRKAMLAQLGRQQMTYEELADELDHIAARNVIRRELLRMVGQDLICSIETKGKHDVFETWDRALERVRGNRHRHTVKTRTRTMKRIA
jgi:hypothetical protein